jgi:hypothetical protein
MNDEEWCKLEHVLQDLFERARTWERKTFHASGHEFDIRMLALAFRDVRSNALEEARLMGGPRGADYIAGRREGIEAALSILDDWRARENEWFERARKGDIALKVNAAGIATDARSREAVLRGAAADIRYLLQEKP